MTGILIKRENLDTDMYREKTKHREKPAGTAEDRDLEQLLPSQPSKRTKPANIFISNF